MDEKITCLIVDDKEANLLALKALLEDENLNIIKAKSGAEALKKVFLYEIDIILLDVQMPEMSGFEVAEILRTRDKTKTIPIIFITAISKTEKYVFKGYELGAVDYIYKPIKNEILLNKIKVFIRLVSQKREIERKNKILREKMEEIERISSTDQLTGVANRRGFEDKLKKEWARCLRAGQFFSLLMIDIDFFKNYNDSYGHIKGDVCLKKVAKEIADTLKRPYDEVIRYGGEEFLVILPETSPEGTKYVSELIRKNIEGLKIEHKTSSVSDYVTVSVGGASKKVSKLDGSLDLLKQVDKYLYKAKENGRNQYCCN